MESTYGGHLNREEVETIREESSLFPKWTGEEIEHLAETCLEALDRLADLEESLADVYEFRDALLAGGPARRRVGEDLTAVLAGEP